MARFIRIGVFSLLWWVVVGGGVLCEGWEHALLRAPTLPKFECAACLFLKSSFFLYVSISLSLSFFFPFSVYLSAYSSITLIFHCARSLLSSSAGKPAARDLAGVRHGP
jgi:hypothetical protein